MTTRQDQNARGSRNGVALDTARVADTGTDGQPLSRRAAREREREAAEALAQGQSHPSGVVDFDAHDFGTQFGSDQAFQVQDTSDIWAALSRRSDEPPTPEQPPAAQLAQFQSGVPLVPETQGTATGESSAVSGELLDRVRGAVLGRDREALAQPSPAPERRPLTRREMRAQQASEAREDDLPAAWFAPGAQPQAQPFAQPQAFLQPEPATDDGEPYDPEPTVAITALRPTELESQSPMTAPVNLPQFFAEPAGDDALTFSSPVQLTPAEQLDEHPDAEADPAFLEPRAPWSELADRQAPTFSGPELGPPSEVTDLAGFEALIRQARNTPPVPQRAEAPAPRPSLPWADDEDAQEGFTGLLSRSVQGSHGSPNALILPNDPQPDLTQAVSGTGDIFITGSMNLSRSLSTTGGNADHYDSLDMDRIFDGSDDDAGAAGVRPVRASSAVSGATPNRPMVGGGRRAPGNVLPTVLAIIAGAMAVGVVTLLVGSWVLKLF
jgi:hypothetical protein